VNNESAQKGSLFVSSVVGHVIARDRYATEGG